MIEGKVIDAKDDIKLGWLKNWKSPFKETDEGNLVVPGQNELYNLGKRFNDKYQSLFPDNQYNPILYPLQTTFVPRVSMSGNAFGYAIFGEAEGHIGPGHYQPIYSFTDMKGKDINLRFFEACKKYVDQMNDTEHVEDKVKFADKYFPSIAERVTAMIGAAPNFVITRENITSIYDLCSFEYVIYNITSQFCSLFAREDFEIFELYYDIGSYHIKGYGWDLSYQIASPLVKDIVDKFNAKINGSDKYTKAFLRFGHAETILPLLSLLGLYKDDFPLKWDTDLNTLRTRKWRMSDISSFSSNVVVILHNCSDGYKVETQHNEGQVILEGCDGQVFCPYDLFLKKVDFINNFDFDKVCDTTSPKCVGTEFTPTLEITALIGLFIICVLSIITGTIVYLKQNRNPYVDPQDYR
jgi:multiple inositol-polyphosphate phosphatase/2,3-bisphosphoglycerate 3-phosphatase